MTPALTIVSAAPGSLRHLQLFHGCDDRDLAQIDRLATWIEVERGRVLCREDEPGHQFFVIVRGAVVVSRRGQVRHHLAPGAAFGEMALVDLAPRAATVTAIESTELLIFNRTDFAALLDRVPRVARELLRIAALRLRAAETR